MDIETAAALRKDAKLQACADCGAQSYLDVCPICPDQKPLDLFARLTAREAAGETVDWQTEYDDIVWGKERAA